MPISPTPPSGAKTSSSEGRTIMDSDQSTRLAGGRGRQDENVPGRDRHGLAVGQAQHEAAGMVDRLEAADNVAVGKTHAHVFAHPGRAREPIRADGRKALPTIPLRDASHTL